MPANAMESDMFRFSTLVSTMLLIGWALACCPVARASEVAIPDGDTQALLNALAAASSSTQPTDIVLAANGTYVLPSGTVTFDGEVSVHGNGSTLVSSYAFLEEDTHTNLRIAQGADVTLMQLEFAGQFGGAPWLGVAGQLSLTAVTIDGQLAPTNLTLQPPSGWAAQTTLLGVRGNNAYLNMRNTTIATSIFRVDDPFYATTGDFSYQLIAVSGGASTTMQHVTLRAQQSFASEHHVAVVGVRAGRTAETAASRIKIRNSLVMMDVKRESGTNVQMDIDACMSLGSGVIAPQGGNISSDATCGFAATTTDAGFGSFGDFGGPVPTLSLRGGSPAIRFGASAWCLPRDARGYVRRGDRCDSGAFGYGAAVPGRNGSLYGTGAAGYWTIPGKKGFLAVSFPAPGTPMLVWSTFDAAGHGVTIYGIGTFVDSNTIAVPSAARDQPVAGTDPVRLQSVPWGALRLHLQSCARARLQFDSQLPTVGSGTRRLHRLSVVSSVGCTTHAEPD